jgi:hypothetical protein
MRYDVQLPRGALTAYSALFMRPLFCLFSQILLRAIKERERKNVGNIWNVPELAGKRPHET